MDHAGLHLSGCCTTPSTKEQKLVESKLLAKPNLSTTANSPNEHEDDVISIGEYNIDGAPVESGQIPVGFGETTTLMMTDVVAPSTERGGVQRLIDWGFFEDAKISENFLRVVEDATKTEDAVPYWKIDDFLGFPGFSWVWVVLRAARAKKVETKRFYLQKSVPIQPKTSNILPKFCQKFYADWPCAPGPAVSGNGA